MKRSELIAVLPVHAAGAAAACVIIGVGAMVLFMPSLDAHAQQASTRDDVKDLVGVAVNRRTQLRAIENQRADLQARLHAGGIVLDPPEHLAGRLGLLARLSAARSVTILELTPGERRTHELCDVVEIRMSVAGTASAVTGLLGDVASSDQGLAVRVVKLNADNAPVSGQIQAELTLDWYAKASKRSANG